jgi:hypothetical protein
VPADVVALSEKTLAERNLAGPPVTGPLGSAARHPAVNENGLKATHRGVEAPGGDDRGHLFGRENGDVSTERLSQPRHLLGGYAGVQPSTLPHCHKLFLRRGPSEIGDHQRRAGSKAVGDGTKEATAGVAIDQELRDEQRRRPVEGAVIGEVLDKALMKLAPPAETGGLDARPATPHMGPEGSTAVKRHPGKAAARCKSSAPVPAPTQRMRASAGSSASANCVTR